jgi:glutathione S-transferase
MILIGQYDSPFVRRVAIALHLYGIVYEHRPWSVFGDADLIAAYNPLRRVPTLVLDDGEVLIESATILDYFDELAGPKALTPRHGLPRQHALKVCALATGLGEKGLSLLYERVLHKATSQTWIERCNVQISDVLDALETSRQQSSRPFWFGDDLSHADIAVACVLRFITEAHKGVFQEVRWPALASHAARCEALELFQKISQPFYCSAPTL